MKYLKREEQEGVTASSGAAAGHIMSQRNETLQAQKDQRGNESEACSRRKSVCTLTL